MRGSVSRVEAFIIRVLIVSRTRKRQSTTIVANLHTWPMKKQNDSESAQGDETKGEPAKGEQSKEKVLKAFFSNESSDEMNNNWFTDSGASSHMASRKEFLHNLRAVQQKEILIANNEKLKENLIGIW